MRAPATRAAWLLAAACAQAGPTPSSAFGSR